MASACVHRCPVPWARATGRQRGRGALPCHRRHRAECTSSARAAVLESLCSLVCACARRSTYSRPLGALCSATGWILSCRHAPRSSDTHGGLHASRVCTRLTFTCALASTWWRVGPRLNPAQAPGRVSRTAGAHGVVVEGAATELTRGHEAASPSYQLPRAVGEVRAPLLFLFVCSLLLVSLEGGLALFCSAGLRVACKRAPS